MPSALVLQLLLPLLITTEYWLEMMRGKALSRLRLFATGKTGGYDPHCGTPPTPLNINRMKREKQHNIDDQTFHVLINRRVLLLLILFLLLLLPLQTTLSCI